MMNEDLETEILSSTERKSKQNAHKKWTTKKTLLVIIFLLLLLCFVFILLYVLERVSNSAGGKNQSCPKHCLTQICVKTSDRK